MVFGSRNRRKETRFRNLTGTRLAWNNESGARARRKGWTLDDSGNGLGFLAEKPRLPQPGQTIRVRRRPDQPDQLYEVVRIVTLPGKLGVVGCERLYGKEAELALPEPAWSQSKRQTHHASAMAA